MLKLKNEYINGRLNKADYILQMYGFHEVLLQYPKLIGDTDIERIVIEKDNIYVTLNNGINLIVRELDERTVPVEIMNFNSYEKQEWENVFTLIDKTDYPRTVLDIGGNVGYISLLLKNKWPESDIIAFEPIKSTYDVFCNNVKLNGMDIKVENIGLADEEGEFTYYYYPEGSGNSSLKNLSHRDSVQELKAQVKTVDNYVVENNITDIDFIKMDIEGAEFLALKGAKKTIEKNKPVMYIELLRKWSASFNYKPQDVVEWLNELGYGCFVFKENRMEKIFEINENTVETNFLFIHETKFTLYEIA